MAKCVEELSHSDVLDKGIPDVTAKTIAFLKKRGKCLCTASNERHIDSRTAQNIANKEIDIFGVQRTVQLYTDYGFAESLLQPFGSYGDNGIRNPYFRDIFDDLFAFQYSCCLAREDTDTPLIYVKAL